MAILRWRRPGRRGFGLWIPLFLVWLLLLPLILILLPIVIALIAASGGRPFRTLAVLWGVLNALSGTRIEMDIGRRAVFILII